MTATALRILLLEPDAVLAGRLTVTLHGLGHDVTVAADAADALRLMQATPFPVVVAARAAGGVGLCQTIRAVEWGMAVYVVLRTDAADRRPVTGDFDAGVDEFLEAPFDADAVQTRLRTAARVLQLETHDVTIVALAKLAESRDSDTGRHIERVQAYCRVLGERMLAGGDWPEVNHAFVRLLFQTSPLHDIGKVSVPDAILLKPGKLSPAEFAVMKTHTLHGAETLAAAAEHRPQAAYLEMARQIALSHHERWDGTGYPHNLAGTDIPLAARVVAVADVYDALTSRRLYKDAYSHETARTIILDGAGKHFDPRIVDVFRSVEIDFARIRRALGERMQLASAAA